ncbi:MAG: signal peptidase II [Bacteriovoracaceae bacterium]
MNRIWAWALMITALILIDQFSKGVIEQHYRLGESTEVISGFFNITYVRNTGAAFGMGANAAEIWRKILFLFIPVMACFYIIYLIWTARKERYVLGFSYSLILAGAIGNLIDRFSLGYVVDMFDFYLKGSHFPAFNVADACISVAAGLLIIDYFMDLKRNKVKEA